MGKIVLSCVLIGLMVTLSVGISFAEPMKGKATGTMLCNKSVIDLRMSMRKLWEDHIIYTRNYIISSLADLEDAGKIAERLLKNQENIGEAIKPYYGNEAGNKLTGLLKDHIMIAAEVIKVAKKGTQEEFLTANKKWEANAEEIAAFLSSANPNWPKQEMINSLYKHLTVTIGEVVSRLKKDWDGDISYYDKGHDHILVLADTLTEGIIKQFPGKFKK